MFHISCALKSDQYMRLLTGVSVRDFFSFLILQSLLRLFFVCQEIKFSSFYTFSLARHI